MDIGVEIGIDLCAASVGWWGGEGGSNTDVQNVKRVENKVGHYEPGLCLRNLHTNRSTH